jgi:hypothetical protein
VAVEGREGPWSSSPGTPGRTPHGPLKTLYNLSYPVRASICTTSERGPESGSVQGRPKGKPERPKGHPNKLQFPHVRCNTYHPSGIPVHRGRRLSCRAPSIRPPRASRGQSSAMTVKIATCRSQTNFCFLVASMTSPVLLPTFDMLRNNKRFMRLWRGLGVQKGFSNLCYRTRQQHSNLGL